MKFGIIFRLVTLSLVVAVLGVLILLATLNSQREAGELGARLSQVEMESFRIADDFRDSQRELNNLMQRYGTEHDPALWDKFLADGQKLSVWINDQKPKFTTKAETDALQQLNAGLDDYLRAAKELQPKIQALGSRSATLEDFTPLRMVSQRLSDLGMELGKAHYASRQQLLIHANRTLKHLRWSVLGSLGLLFLFGLTLAAVVCRDMIAPLRTRLVESQSLAERHEKLAALGMLAAGVAHEIRNPLTAIKAALFIQQKKFPAASPEFADAKLVEREIMRLERIVNDFLRFARPTEPELKAISTDQLLRETQQFLQPELARNNIRLETELSPSVPVSVDAAQIKQVLINLVQNAAESIGRDGTVRLRTRRDHKRLAGTEGDVVILEVIDTGKGIPPEVQKRLFDPFFTTKDTGTGLGLSIAAGIIQKHGGALQYQTQVNHGTTFGIVLPQVAG